MGHLITGVAHDMIFPTLTQKYLMVRLANIANDDGSGVWPSIEMLAYQAQQTPRSVRYNMSGFRNATLIDVTHPGGRGKGDTRQYNLNLDIMVSVAMGTHVLEGTKDSLKLVEMPVDDTGERGNSVPPSATRRLNQIMLRVNSGVPLRVNSGVHPNLPESPIESPATCAGAHESGGGYQHLDWVADQLGIGHTEASAVANQLISQHGTEIFSQALTEFRTKLEGGLIKSPSLKTLATFVANCTPAPPKKSKLDAFAKGKADTRAATFTISRTDPQWKAWMDHLAVEDEDVFATVQRTGKLETSTRWPNPSSIVHTKANNPTNDADRITGDVDR